MARIVDIEKSSGYFIISIDKEIIKKYEVKDMKEDSPLLLRIAEEQPSNKEISIPGTGVNFILLEKNVNLVFKYKSLLKSTEPLKTKIQMKENNILKTNRIDEYELNYLYIYYPEEKYVDGTISNELLEFAKKSKNYFYSYFPNLIYEKYVDIFDQNVIQKLIGQEEMFVICCVPSHDECDEINNVMSFVIKTIKKRYNNNNFIDGSNVLHRKYEIEKSSLNTHVRTYKRQYDSLSVRNSELIKNKSVLLIDDFYTSGSSIKACKYKLLQNGAKKVILFTFGRTR